MSRITDHLPCGCGNVWFALDGGHGAEGIDLIAAVTVAEDGAISAYTGDLVCTRCGQRFETAADLAAITIPEETALTGTDNSPGLRLVVDNTTNP